jgi:hypothetical protein
VARVTIEPWTRPAFQPTGATATAMLVVFADDDVLGAAPDLQLKGAVPAGSPVAALDLRGHHHADRPEWMDGWRGGAVRTIAERDLGDLGRLDDAKCCYSVTVTVDDPRDLTHLQLAWAVAAALARQGAFAVLDVHAVTWLPGPAVADLPADRPFVVQREVSLTAETTPAPGFGHPVHTRGMVKFGRPDLVAGVAADGIEHTAQVLNHLARMLAEGHVLTPGQLLRFDGQRTLRIEPYEPGGAVPEVTLNNEGLLLV